MAEINGYTLVEPPRKGGMAIVYKGKKGAFTRAFKMLRPDKAANNPQLCERFLREINVQTQLDHPNIIKMLDAYPYTDSEGRTSTVLEMEWLKGVDLQRYIEAKAPNGLDAAEVIKIAKRIAEGLEHAHSRNILHLDIKPSNIFRTYDGYIKIIDFGIARVVGENAEIVQGAETVTITTEFGESTFKGTPGYAPTEQQIGEKLGFYTDVFSFGQTLRFLLNGTINPSIDIKDRHLREVIDKCVHPTPMHRYQSFTEVIKALDGEGELIKCSNCGFEVKKTSNFCPECGTPIQQPQPKPEEKVAKCPKCGADRMGAARFCDKCGHDYSKQPTRPNPPKPNPPTPPKVIASYRCERCKQHTKAYADGKVNFCNHCGAPKSSLTPVYK